MHRVIVSKVSLSAAAVSRLSLHHLESYPRNLRQSALIYSPLPILNGHTPNGEPRDTCIRSPIPTLWAAEHVIISSKVHILLGAMIMQKSGPPRIHPMT